MPINTVTLSGNVGRTPEVRYFDSGKVIATFSLAVQAYKNKEKVTLWFDCQAWEGTAKLIGEYVKKGDPITVSGSLDIETWEAKEGGKRSKTVVVVRDVQLAPKASTAEPQQEDDIPF